MEKYTTEIGDFLNLIKRQMLTEKTLKLYEKGQYSFLVNKKLSKKMIKSIFENIFEIKIEKIRTSILPHKTKKVGKFLGKITVYKKVILTLKEGESLIDIFT